MRPTAALARVAFVAGALLAALPTVWAAASGPRDPAAVALPSRDTQAPEAGTTSGGAGGVADQSGAATYSLPILVPPGRRGMAPSLALSYSSQAPLRGGIAVGWSMELPTIERDPARLDGSEFRAGGQRLVPNDTDLGAGLTFRAELDASFARYEYDPGSQVWTVRTLDGVTHVYAQRDPSTTRWRLTQQTDPYGNAVDYIWQTVQEGLYSESLLVGIDYTSNTDAGLAPHAHVELRYARSLSTCGGIPPGAATDHHFGAWRMSGSRTLADIQIMVRDDQKSGWRIARNYHLGYDTAELECTASALRYLERVDVTAYDAAGTPTAAPPIQFHYGPRERRLEQRLWVGGFGGGEAGAGTGPTTMLMDFDGDGWVDRLKMERGEKCTLAMYRGAGIGQFESQAVRTVLPTAAWEGHDTLPSNSEGCTLSGQTTFRGLEIHGQFCYYQSASVSYHFVDWDGDGLVDLLTNVQESSTGLAGGDFPAPYAAADDDGGGQQGGCPTGMTQIGSIDGVPNCTCQSGVYSSSAGGCVADTCHDGTSWDVSADACVSDCQAWDGVCDGDPGGGTGGGGGGGSPGEPDVTQCQMSPPRAEEAPGGYLWRVQRNLGGTLAPIGEALEVKSPAPLPPNPMKTTLAVTAKPGVPTLLDITGDGFLDVLSLDDDPDPENPVTDMPGEATTLYVWPGDGSGSFPTEPEAWWLPQWAQLLDGVGWHAAGGIFTSTSAVSFADVNHDALPDIVVNLISANQLAVAFNQGGSFAAPRLLALAGPVEESRTELTPGKHVPEDFQDGKRASVRQLVDVDADGYPEQLVMLPAGSVLAQAQGRLALRFNGGSLSDADTLGTEWEALEKAVHAVDGRWHRVSDAIDLTGDGVVDLATWTGGGDAEIYTDGAWEAPLRLLTSVDEGRGAVTRFEYMKSTIDGVVDVGDGHFAARHVVWRVVTDPGVGQPELVTTYRYEDPHHGKDGPLDLGPPRFLGFGTVTIDRSGQLNWASARTIKHYSYAPLWRDWGGHLESEWTLLGRPDFSFVPVSQISYAWENRPLLTAVWDARRQTHVWPSFTHEASRIARTCRDGATQESCLASPAAMVTTTETWNPIVGAANAAVVYEHGESRQRTGAVERFTRTASTLRNTGTGYRLLRTLSERGGTTTLERTITVHDADDFPFETWSYQSSSRRAISRRGFDPSTGLLRWEQRPEQVANDTTLVSSTQYDSHQLFAALTTNELGHIGREGHDVATGALVWREGPNERDGMHERQEWKVDGFGRTLERRISTEPDAGGTGYALRVAEVIEYRDATIPNRVIRTAVQDFEAGDVVVNETVHDGLGRVTQAIARRQVAGEPDAITRYRYDGGGELAAMDVPDPREDTGATVTHTWVRDGLGRPTSVIRPDGSAEDIAYRDLDTTITERAPFYTQTRLRRDAFGDLREVLEHQNDGPATTTYRYDALGRMVGIVDAAGSATTFVHDWQGHRTTVKRGGRAWQYVYDLDGNQVAETAPVPPGELEVSYTGYTRYDALGRPEHRYPATRAMGAGERARLGIGNVTYVYDQGTIGELAEVALPFGKIELAYDAQHQAVHESRRIEVPETAIVIEQSVVRSFDALGAPRQVRWDDGTTWRYRHDARGLVDAVEWLDPATGTWTTLAGYTRSVAGAPRSRWSDAEQTRDWQYDVRGRPTYDRIWRPGKAADLTYSERSYGYDGDELAEVWGETAGVTSDASYAYDTRHRLVGARGPLGYTAELDHGPTGNVDVAKITGALDTPDRHVRYQYASWDPQAAEALIDVGDGDWIAQLMYDHQGNVTSRYTQEASYAYRWDGDDLLREATGPDGVERFLYGPGAERLVAVDADGAVRAWFGESETHVAPDGQVQRRWHHVAAGEPIARIADGTDVELQYADTLQNLMLAIGTGGDVRASFLYGAFGELVSATGDADHRRQFNGKENDQASGLRHYGYRSYDPVFLRWASADPLYRFAADVAWTEPQRANLYAFSLNNPVRWLDPDGRDPEAEERTRVAYVEPHAPPPKKPRELQDSINDKFVVYEPEIRDALDHAAPIVEADGQARVIDGLVDIGKAVILLDADGIAAGAAAVTHGQQQIDLANVVAAVASAPDMEAELRNQWASSQAGAWASTTIHSATEIGIRDAHTQAGSPIVGAHGLSHPTPTTPVYDPNLRPKEVAAPRMPPIYAVATSVDRDRFRQYVTQVMLP